MAKRNTKVGTDFRSKLNAAIATAHARGYAVRKGDDEDALKQHAANNKALAAGLNKVGFKATVVRDTVKAVGEDGEARYIASMPGKGAVVLKGKKAIPVNIRHLLKFAAGRSIPAAHA